MPIPTLYIDADACPVKDEVYRVAERTGCPVVVVANSYIRTPEGVRMVVVDAGPDVADDWIADQIKPHDITITSDIPLADRVLKAGGAAVNPKGGIFTRDSIASSLATREIMEHLRSIGETTSGPRPISPKDRSNFLSALDTLVQKAKRARL
jgi:uncharacterized protein